MLGGVPCPGQALDVLHQLPEHLCRLLQVQSLLLVVARERFLHSAPGVEGQFDVDIHVPQLDEAVGIESSLVHQCRRKAVAAVGQDWTLLVPDLGVPRDPLPFPHSCLWRGDHLRPVQWIDLLPTLHATQDLRIWHRILDVMLLADGDDLVVADDVSHVDATAGVDLQPRVVEPDQGPPISAELPDRREQPLIQHLDARVRQHGIRTMNSVEPCGDAVLEAPAESFLVVADAEVPDGGALHLAVTTADASPSCFQVDSGSEPKVHTQW